MDKYIANLLPRLRAYGKKLNKIEEFVDKTWVLEDVFGAVITYRFKHNGILRKTVNGDIHDLRWELEGTDAISVTDPVTRRGEMFRHGFVLDGLLVVQKEGVQTLPLIFYNEAVVSDGDIGGYLLSLIIKRENLTTANDERGYLYKKNDQNVNGIGVGSSVLDKDLSPVSFDVLHLKDKVITIRNGRIESITYFKTFRAKEGSVKVTSSNSNLSKYNISVNDRVEVNNSTTYTGVLNLEKDYTIKVKNGDVVKVNTGAYKYIFAILFFSALVIIVSVLMIRYSSGEAIIENVSDGSTQVNTEQQSTIGETYSAIPVDTGGQYIPSNGVTKKSPEEKSRESLNSNFHDMFMLSNDLTEYEYGQRNKPEDWRRIFIIFYDVASNKPWLYEGYVNELMSVYGSGSVVENEYSRYSLTTFLALIKSKSMRVKSVSSVVGRDNNKTIVVQTWQ